MTLEGQAKPGVDLSALRTISGFNNEGSVFLVGNRRVTVSLLITGLPVVIAIFYACFKPFVLTSWGETNLAAISHSWLAIWIALTIATLVFGGTRHIYRWDIENRTITDLNAAETRAMDLIVRDKEGAPSIELADPLSSGWNLETPVSLLALAEKEDLNGIGEWRPKGLMALLWQSVKDGALFVLFIFPNILLLLIIYSWSMWDFFFYCQLLFLGAWFIGQVASWLLERREYKILLRDDLDA